MFRLIRYIGILLMLVSGIQVRAQSNFAEVDRLTYRLYVEEKWDSLIIRGKEALKQEMDYYYLRMRLGIASYKQKNYRRAGTHFEHALRFNQGDPLALEYLYFARLLSGQSGAASLVRDQFKGDLARRFPSEKRTFARSISLDYLYSAGPKDELIDAQDIPLSGTQYVSRNFQNASLSLTNWISPGFSLVHSLNFLSKTNEYLSLDGTGALYTPEQEVMQAQYYISPQFSSRSGYTWKPMLHLVGIQYQSWTNSATGYQGGSAEPALEDNRELDIVTGLGFFARPGSFDLELGVYYSSLNLAHQFQNHLGATWYPLGNLNLYAGARLDSQFEKRVYVDRVFRLIPGMLFGFAIAEKVWIDLNAAVGEMSNYVEANGSIIFNSFSEVIEKKVSAMLSVPITKKGSLLYAGGRWTANRSEFYPLSSTVTEDINAIHYNVYSIYGGISWKF